MPGLVLLFPLLLLGMAALAVPIAIHLWRRRRYRVIDFPAVMFLQQAVAGRAAGMRLENKRLLLLRLLALTLIVLAFTRPTIRLGAGELRQPGRPATAVIVLDSSFSMSAVDSGITRFDRGVRRAREVLRGLQPGDEAAVVLAQLPPVRLVRQPTPFLDALAQRLGEAEVSPRVCDIGLALAEARAILRPIEDRRRDIYLITDMQESAWESLHPSGSGDERGRINLHVIDVGGAKTPNSAPIHFETDEIAGSENRLTPVRWSVATWGTPSTGWTQAEYTFEGSGARRLRVPLRPDTPAVASAAHAFGAPGYHAGHFQIASDALEIDNTYYSITEIRPPLRVVVLDGAGSALGSAYFIARAVDSLPEPAVCEVVSLPPNAPPPSPRVLRATTLVIVADARALSPRSMEWLQGHIELGGSVWFMPGPGADRDWYNRHVAGPYFDMRISDLVEHNLMRPGRIAQDRVRWRHPLFRAFDQQERTNFAIATFLRYWALEPVEAQEGTPALAAFEDGHPYLLQRPHGRAWLFLSACGMSPLETSLARTPLLVPLLGEILRHCDSHDSVETQYTIGDVVTLRVELATGSRNEAVEVVTPSGNAYRLDVPLQPGRPAYTVSFYATDEAGVYSVRSDGQNRTRPARFAVNLDRRGSDLTPITLEEAGKRAADYNVATLAQQPRDIERVFQRQEGFPLAWLMAVAALLLVVGEAWFANHGLERS